MHINWSTLNNEKIAQLNSGKTAWPQVESVRVFTTLFFMHGWRSWRSSTTNVARCRKRVEFVAVQLALLCRIFSADFPALMIPPHEKSISPTQDTRENQLVLARPPLYVLLFIFIHKVCCGSTLAAVLNGCLYICSMAEDNDCSSWFIPIVKSNFEFSRNLCEVW